MRIDKEKTVAFISNRSLLTPAELEDRNVENVIRTELFYVIEDIYKEGKNNFLSGMESGFELLVAEAVLDYAHFHKDVQLYLIFPFVETEFDYSSEKELRQRHIIDNSTHHVVLSDKGCDKDIYKRKNDFLVDNSSEIIIYEDYEESDITYIRMKADRNNIEVWNMYEELEEYFSNHSSVKKNLQNYPDVQSFKYCREGVIFQLNNQIFSVSFEEIIQVKEKNEQLYFTLKSGGVIIASLLSADCYAKSLSMN